jgi:hypothetical protein
MHSLYSSNKTLFRVIYISFVSILCVFCLFFVLPTVKATCCHWSPCNAGPGVECEMQECQDCCNSNTCDDSCTDPGILCSEGGCTYDSNFHPMCSDSHNGFLWKTSPQTAEATDSNLAEDDLSNDIVSKYNFTTGRYTNPALVPWNNVPLYGYSLSSLLPHPDINLPTNDCRFNHRTFGYVYIPEGWWNIGVAVNQYTSPGSCNYCESGSDKCYANGKGKGDGYKIPDPEGGPGKVMCDCRPNNKTPNCPNCRSNCGGLLNVWMAFNGKGTNETDKKASPPTIDFGASLETNFKNFFGDGITPNTDLWNPMTWYVRPNGNNLNFDVNGRALHDLQWESPISDFPHYFSVGWYPIQVSHQSPEAWTMYNPKIYWRSCTKNIDHTFTCPEPTNITNNPASWISPQWYQNFPPNQPIFSCEPPVEPNPLTCTSFSNGGGTNLNGCLNSSFPIGDCIVQSSSVSLNMTSNLATQIEIANADSSTSDCSTDISTWEIPIAINPGDSLSLSRELPNPTDPGIKKVCVKYSNGTNSAICEAQIKLEPSRTTLEVAAYTVQRGDIADKFNNAGLSVLTNTIFVLSHPDNDINNSITNEMQVQGATTLTWPNLIVDTGASSYVLTMIPPDDNYHIETVGCKHENDATYTECTNSATRSINYLLFNDNDKDKITSIHFGLVPAGSWIQVSGGNVMANGSIVSEIPPLATIRKFNTGQGLISYNSLITDIDFSFEPEDYGTTLISNSNNMIAKESNLEYYQSGKSWYDYFYTAAGRPENPETQDTPLSQPASSETIRFYKTTTGNPIKTQGAWTVGDGDKLVIFVDGNLEITDSINKTGSGFIAFIVSGNITVDSTVGTAWNETTPTLMGLYVTNGTFSTGSSSTVGKERFVGKGIFVAHDFNLAGRDLTVGDPTANFTTSANLFIHDPSLLFTIPSSLQKTTVSWKEINPFTILAPSPTPIASPTPSNTIMPTPSLTEAQHYCGGEQSIQCPPGYTCSQYEASQNSDGECVPE